MGCVLEHKNIPPNPHHNFIILVHGRELKTNS